MYKNDRECELSDATLQSHGYRLDQFLTWCDIEDVNDLNHITGRDLHRFKMYRKA
jgi:hypothetical protein